MEVILTPESSVADLMLGALQGDERQARSTGLGAFHCWDRITPSSPRLSHHEAGAHIS